MNENIEFESLDICKVTFNGINLDYSCGNVSVFINYLYSKLLNLEGYLKMLDIEIPGAKRGYRNIYHELLEIEKMIDNEEH